MPRLLRRIPTNRLPRVLALGAFLALCAFVRARTPVVELTEFVVLPRQVHVGGMAAVAGASFSLEIVAMNATGVPDPVSSATWTATLAGVTFTPATGNPVRLTLPSPDGTTHFTVTATSGASTSAMDVFLDGEPTPVQDQVRGFYTWGTSPDATLLTGNLAGSCAHDFVTTFVGWANIGDYLDNAGVCDRTEIAIFSTSSRPTILRPYDWTSGSNVVQARHAFQTLTDSLHFVRYLRRPMIGIPLRIVIGVPPAQSRDAAAAEGMYLLYAGGVFKAARSGIAWPPSNISVVVRTAPATFVNCAGISSLPPSLAPAADRLNIYHIPEVIEGLPVAGEFCDPNVILMSDSYAITSTLAHELGHALGLMQPFWGHTTTIEGFKRSDNVMWTSAEEGNDYRSRFSLGQVYRMHVDGRSYLRRDSDLDPGPFTCGCDPYATNVCPALPADLRPPLSPLPPSLVPCM